MVGFVIFNVIYIFRITFYNVMFDKIWYNFDYNFLPEKWGFCILSGDGQIKTNYQKIFL